METQELVLSDIQNQVEKITSLKIKENELIDMVKMSKQITVPDLSNKQQVALAKESRLKLRKVEIDIEKEAKGYRDIFTSVNKKIRENEKSLLAITAPEIERLTEIEKEAEKIQIRNARLKLLPEQKEELAKIGDGIEVDDEELLAMDTDAYYAYRNQRIANKNEADRLAVEAEKARIENEKLEMQREKENLEREQKAREEAQIEAERKLKLAEQEADRRVIEERERIEKEQKEKEEAEMREKEEAEMREKEEKEKLEKQKKYQNWLIKNNYNESTDEISITDTEIKLYRLVSVYKK